MPRWRTRIIRSILLLILGLPLLATLGFIWLQQQIKAAGISELSIHWQQLGLHSAKMSQLQFRFQPSASDAAFDVDLNELSLQWRWLSWMQPQLTLVTSRDAHIIYTAATPEPQQAKTPGFEQLSLPEQWQLPAFLPQQIHFPKLQLDMPCPAGRCQLSSQIYASYDSQQQQWQWQSQLTDEAQLISVKLDAFYRPDNNTPALDLTLQLDQQLALTLKQQFNLANQQASTQLALSISPPSAALLQLLTSWQLTLPERWLTEFTQPLQLASNLNWAIPEDGNLQRLLQSHQLDWHFAALAPSPFILPWGWLQGEVQGQLNITDGVINRWQVKSEMSLSQLQLAQLQQQGIQLPGLMINLSSETSEPMSLAALPLNISVKSQPGAADNALALNSEMRLKLNLADLAVIIEQGNAALSLPQWQLTEQGLSFKQIQWQGSFHGHWQADNWQLQLQDDNALKLSLTHPLLTIEQIHLSITNMQLQQVKQMPMQLSTQLAASMQGLQHASLVKQHWQWQADTKLELVTANNTASLKATLNNGVLSNDMGLSLQHQLDWRDENLALQWQLADMFLLAGNPLAGTFSDWPALLELNRGRLGANGDIRWQQGKLSGRNQLQLRDLSGIYDRTLVKGINADMQLSLHDSQFNISSDNLVINQINHGLELGPLKASAQYSATMAQPGTGVIALEQLALQVMGGNLSVSPQQLDLAQESNQLTFQINQLDLAQLLQQHPSTDIKGQGKLSGTLPISISKQGITIKAGRVAAEQPGGKIQYQSASSSGMGSVNQSMQLVFSALEDFHFTVLASEISYDTSGKLLLALNLRGANPALQQGRAINLNINLEEDLPAMITSLQLTNKLNDTITKRVQQYIQQKQAAAAAAGAKK